MGRVILDMAMSLDGSATDRDGRSLYPIDTLRDAPAFVRQIAATGAVLMGRGTYEIGARSGGFVGYEYQVPIVVVTHAPPPVVARGVNERLGFVFVAGMAEGVSRARQLAGRANVMVVGGVGTARQCIAERLIDAAIIRLLPVVVGGGGTRLFDGVDGARLRVVATTAVADRVDVEMAL